MAHQDGFNMTDESGFTSRRLLRFIILIAFLWFFAATLSSGEGLEDWITLRGDVPGTAGILAKGHLLLIGLIALIANFVLRIPQQGGPLVEEEDSEDEEFDDVVDRWS